MDQWQDIAKWLWGVLVPVGAWAWNKQDKRLDKIEENMVSRAALAERKADVDHTLEARRQDVIALHEKIDTHIKEDGLIHNAMLEKLAQIGSDVAFIKGKMDR